jgi:large subunit ribosomal protein L15
VEELNRFEDGAVVTVEALLEAGVIKRAGDGVKVLGNGELTKKLDVKVNRYSASAIEKIKALGGTAEVI